MLPGEWCCSPTSTTQTYVRASVWWLSTSASDAMDHNVVAVTSQTFVRRRRIDDEFETRDARDRRAIAHAVVWYGLPLCAVWFG
jgi:hypothetical protein